MGGIDWQNGHCENQFRKEVCPAFFSWCNHTSVTLNLLNEEPSSLRVSNCQCREVLFASSTSTNHLNPYSKSGFLLPTFSTKKDESQPHHTLPLVSPECAYWFRKKEITRWWRGWVTIKDCWPFLQPHSPRLDDVAYSGPHIRPLSPVEMKSWMNIDSPTNVRLE